MAQFNGIKNYTISSSIKNQDKYQAANIQAEFIDKLDWTVGSETLNNYKYSIYFEDIHTHSNFAYLANRYYETLMCDVLMFFDAKCIKTIEESRKMGYIIDDLLIVHNADEMNATVDFLEQNEKEYKKALNSQRKNIFIAEQHRTETLNRIKSILS
jgi:predicted glycosyltransferase involved in capsule biosynthesis